MKNYTATWKDRLRLKDTRWEIIHKNNWFHIIDKKHNMGTEVWMPTFWDCLDILVRTFPDDFKGE